MTIAAILSRKTGGLLSVECDTPVREAVAMLAANKIGSLPVLRGGRVVGIMSERDIIYGLARDGADVLDWKVEKVMTSPAITVTPDVPVLSALSQMSRKRIRHLPVVDDDKLIGIVSIGDLVAYRIEKIEQEAEAMRAYIQSA
ncbi:MAG TPA: CBS domain-containing protein [Allosphingosinicella sp.]|jgi:CBS domain-containing protein|uniref:CBS domain-containing protein n=1 Tax=Allosphingosinicella sp. TaxID=2823234 RepID=UPI002F276D81